MRRTIMAATRLRSHFELAGTYVAAIAQSMHWIAYWTVIVPTIPEVSFGPACTEQ